MLHPTVSPLSALRQRCRQGSGPNHGHYVALVRAYGRQWLCFDDDAVEPIEESQIEAYFGTPKDTAASTETGYILFYEEVPTSVE